MEKGVEVAKQVYIAKVSTTIAGSTLTTRYAYNLALQVTQITYPSGLQLHKTLDSLGRTSTVTVNQDDTATPIITTSISIVSSFVQ